MTETTDSPEKYDFETDPHGLQREDVIPHDYYLEDTLRLLHGDKNDSDIEFNLTVVIDGAVVSGLVISNKKWATLTTELLNGAFPNLGKEFAAGDEFVREVHEARVDQRLAESRPAMALKFIHMRDVTILGGGGRIQFPLWRGKISHVSGWSFGSMNSPEGAQGE